MKYFKQLLILSILLSFIYSIQLKTKSTSATSQVVNLFVNGDFQINTIPVGEISTFQTDVSGWITDDQIEVAIGKEYNSNWEDGKFIVELDGKNNDSISQIINVTEAQVCKLSFRYAATYPRKLTCELRVKFNGLNIFQKNLSDDYLIHEQVIDVSLALGNNIFSFEAFLPANSDGYGMNITDVKLLCGSEVTIAEVC